MEFLTAGIIKITNTGFISSRGDVDFRSDANYVHLSPASRTVREWQHRGSPTCHDLAWLSEAPQLLASNDDHDSLMDATNDSLPTRC